MTDTTLNWSEWLLKSRFAYMSEEQKKQTMVWLLTVRDAVLNNAEIQPHHTVLDIGTGTGLLAFGAINLIGDNGKVVFSDKFQDCLDVCNNIVSDLNIKKNIEFLLSGCEKIDLPKEAVDRAVMRSVLVHIMDKKQAFSEIYRVLKPEGIYSAFEPVIRSNTRCSALITENDVSDYYDFKKAEDECMSSPEDPLTNFDEKTIADDLTEVGFTDGVVDRKSVESKYIVQENMVESWLTTPPSPNAKTMKEKFLLYFEEPKVNRYMLELQQALNGKEVSIKSNVLYIKAIK